MEYRENTQDTNVTIHYNRIQKIREILTKQSITGENREYARYYSNNLLQQKTVNARDTYVAIDYRRKQRMREILT